MNETPHLVPISVFSFANIRLHVEYCKFRPIKLFYHEKLFNRFGQPYNVPRVSIINLWQQNSEIAPSQILWSFILFP